MPAMMPVADIYADTPPLTLCPAVTDAAPYAPDNEAPVYNEDLPLMPFRPIHAMPLMRESVCVDAESHYTDANRCRRSSPDPSRR